MDLMDIGIIVEGLEKTFTDLDGAERLNQQMLCLSEEVGEFTGAFRRFHGLARRDGTFEDMAAELADVVIASHMVAHYLGIQLMFDAENFATHCDCEGFDAVNARVILLNVFNGKFLATTLGGEIWEMAEALAELVAVAYDVAYHGGVNLDKEITAKLEKIFTRGWKENSDG